MAEANTTEQQEAALLQELKEAEEREALEKELAEAEARESQATPTPRPQGDYGAPEIAAATFRKAATSVFPPSESVYFQPLEGAAYIGQLLMDGQYDTAKSVIDQWKQGVALGYEKQKRIEKEYPTLMGTTEMVAAGIPLPIAKAPQAASLAEKAARTALTAIPKIGTELGAAVTLPKALLETSKAGAKAGALMSVGEETGRATAEAAGVKGAQGTPEQVALRVGMGTAFPAVAAPALGAGVAGVMAAKSKLGEIGMSPGAQRIYQTLFGVPPKTQAEYLANKQAVDALPSDKNLVNGLKEIKDYLEKGYSGSEASLEAAKTKIKEAENVLQTARKMAKENEAIKLSRAEAELGILKERVQKKINDLERKGGQLEKEKEGLKEEVLAPAERKAKFTKEEFELSKARAVGGARTEAKIAERALTEQTKAFSAGKYIDEISNAVGEVKARSGELSQEAINALPDDVFVDKKVLLDAIQAEIAKASAGGGIATGAASNIRMLQNIYKRALAMPEERMLAAKLKAITQDFSKDLAPTLKTKYMEQGQASIDGIRFRLADYLRKEFPEYAEKMPPVAEATRFVREIAERELNTPSKIKSVIQQAATDPRAQQILDDLERLSGRPIKQILSEFRVAQEAAKGSNLEIAKSRLPEVIRLNQLLDDLKNTNDPKARARIQAQIPYAEEAAQAKADLLTASDPATLRELESQLPAMKSIREMEGMIDLIQSKDFNAAVMRNLGIVPESDLEAIIALRNQIANLSHPESIRFRVQQSTLEHTADLGAAVKAGIEAEQKFNRWKDAYDPFKGKESGENIVLKIIRNPDGPISDPVIRMARALAQLEDKQIAEFFKAFGFGDPKQAERLFKNLKLQAALETSRARGSRAVQLYSRVMSAVVNAIKLSDPAASASARGLGEFMKGFGTLMGAYMDYGSGRVLKSILSRVSEMNGIYSYEKLMRALPDSNLFSIQIAEQVAQLADQVRQQKVTEISQASIESVNRDIMASSLPSIKKARASMQVKSGFIEGPLLADLLEAGMPKASEPLAARMVRFTQ